VTEVAKLCKEVTQSNQKWCAIYTRPRWEKKVHKLLTEKGIESYCPLNKVRRKWSDRIKLIEEPLFKSYVFVKVGEEQRTSVRMTDGVINFVYWDGKPAIIKEKEIESIRKFLNEHEHVEVIKLEVLPEQKVVITSGPFMNLEGKVVEVKHKSARVLVESLGYMLLADIEKTRLLPVKNN
jgi:transcription antitermination factor NusG